MSDLIIDSFLLIRSSAYSYENFGPDFLQRVLQTDFFRAALFFASQSFYLELRKKSFDYEQLTENSRLTLWKYLNRMCFRPLPYGLFASYSALGWATGQGEKMCFTSAAQLHVHPDFKLITAYINQLDTAVFEELKYYTNSSLYHSGGQLRFISQGYSSSNKFVIVQLKMVPGLKKLLKFISTGRSRKEILEYLRAAYGDDLPVSSYFDSLKDGQLIVSALMPNVTGLGYNERCLSLLEQYPITGLEKLKSFNTTLNAEHSSFPVLNDYIEELIHNNVENQTYSLYERNVAGGLNLEIQQELIELIQHVDKLTADQEIGVMQTFRAKFVEKYEQQEVSLMEVLDPGQGIGYENLATAFDAENEGFIEDLRVREVQKKNTPWGSVAQMIFKKWNNLRKSGMGKILLTAEELKELPESKHILPPGMFVLFKRVDGENWIDHIGGVSGIELSSRFGTQGTVIEAGLKEICKKEMAVNSDYVFAEIAYSPNDRASNINRRGSFYAYEIPVLTHPSLSADFTIELNDLMVSVVGQNVMLRSVRLNKYILPRLSTAYNYQLSVIPVLRFLCDLQFQGVKSNLSFSLTSMFPEMDYYPRVQLDNAILSPATWILNEQQLRKLDTAEDWYFFEELNLPSYFSWHEGDNFLVFNKNSPADLDVFRKCIRNKKTAKLIEYIFPEQKEMEDESGQPFALQLIACAINQKPSYELPKNHWGKPDKNLMKLKGVSKVKRSFLPGEEWLYLKVYAHYSVMDEILTQVLLPAIKKYKKNNPGFKWFFIRYQDPNYHLRLRFYPAAMSCYAMLADLMQKLQPLSRSGKIADIMLDSYQRELEKYSPVYITEAESFFYRSTEFTLTAFLMNPLTKAYKLSFAVTTSLKIIQYFIEDGKQREFFFTEVLDNLSNEFSRDKEIIHKMDAKYRKFQKELIAQQKMLMMQQHRNVYRHYLRIVKEISFKTEQWGQNDRYDLLINIVHVHINRIFENNSREYEYLTYHFMKKHQAYLNYNPSG